jgi:hypothetical protein
MSSILAPRWALIAGAVDGVGDTHLSPGVHVRALPSPALGLPATPLAVYRAVVGPETVKRLAQSGEVIWIDSNGATLVLPFAVAPDNPVYGFFPPTDVIYAELLATPVQGPVPGVGGLVNLADLLKPTMVVRRPITELSPAGIGAFPRPTAAAEFIERAEEALAAFAGTPGSLRFEALANSEYGPAPFASRSAEPYAIAAWTIPLVRVVGRGTVTGIRWIDAARVREFQKEAFWELWSLPVDPAPRYVPTATAKADAIARIARAAATRQPMYVAYGAAGPGTAPAAIPDDAEKRVDQIRGDLDRWLQILLNDLSHPTAGLVDTHVIPGNNGSATVPIEPFVIAGAVDPDVGHHLGFGDVDQKAAAAPGALVLYRLRGLWRWLPTQWRTVERPPFIPAIRADASAAVQSFPELRQFNVVPRERGAFVDLHAMAVALIGTPPDPPPPVSFDAATDRGWLATPPPPNVRRALRLTASGFRPHAVAALAATDSNGDRTLHAFPNVGRLQVGKPLPSGTPLPLVVSRPQDATSPGEGRFEDRDAPEGPVLYRLAQGDWFGRWGGWRTRSAPAKVRTPPMRPTIEIYPHPPAVPTPVPDTPLTGLIEVRIPIPRTPDLPAGGAGLARLDLDETFAGDPTTTTPYTLGGLVGATIEPHPAPAHPAHDLIVIQRTGPALARAAQRGVVYAARWIDNLGHVSANADPAARTITDPRPPLPPPVITELRYTARPDAEGHARVDLDFDSTSGTRYRVFVSNETTLLKALDSHGEVAAAATIRAAAPGAPRAMQFRVFKSLFGWDEFESVTKMPIIAASTTTHFVHRVSGSLDVLTIYRVLGEGPSGALSEMTEAELVPFAVPNLGGPGRPQVALVNAGLDPTTQGIRLRVKVPVGKASPKAWRLRRASVPIQDPLRMNIVDQGLVAGASTDRESTSFEFDATAALKPWRHYRFAVEVQADDPPGAPTVGVILPGEWSEASAPATLAVIPNNGPAPPSAVQIANVAGALAITVTHPAPDTLIGTALGPHRFEAWRCEPGARPIRLDGIAFVRGVGASWVANTTGTSSTGAYVSVRIIDPVGRRSDACVSNQI